MITVEEATKIVLENTIPFPIISVPVEEAIGRILMEDLVADRDFPPYNRVAMDGIAIAFAAFEKGQRSFPIESVGAAGAPQLQLETPKNCVEIMTGAVLPDGADTVIRYEDVEIENGIATIQIDNIQAKQNIHTKGLDRKAGETVVHKGKIISAAEIGVAATVGKAELKVLGYPKAIIISSGDELVEISETPLPHQIRKSNVHRLRATFKQWGLKADIAHLIDDEAQIYQELKKIITDYQIVVMSGGVSKGKFDFIPKILDQLGVKKLFHKVRQRPGKPFWFGKVPNGSIVFALPGNPVSSFMCTHRYIRPWLKACLGLPPLDRPYAILQEGVRFKPELTYQMQVRLEFAPSGQLLAFPIHGHGSGDLANLSDADAFMELPRERSEFRAGEVFPVLGYRNI